MGKIELIQKAIEDASNGISKLPQEVLELPSFSTPKIRHLLNNLGAISTKYFEVGLFKGGTFISTNYGNSLLSIGADNFSQFNEDGNAKRECFDNLHKYLEGYNFKMWDIDCFEFDVLPIGENIYRYKENDIGLETINSTNEIDMFFYDGNHSYLDQRRAVSFFINWMADEFILVVDDFSWQEVKRGTYDGIKEASLEILYEQVIWDGMEGGSWWNGISVFLLKKST